MPYQLIVATMPEEAAPALAFKNWSLFSGHAQTPTLKTTTGIFWMSANAWLFDTRRALPDLVRLQHRALEYEIPLTLLVLPDETVRSLIISYPSSERLEAFLKQEGPKAPLS
jgi:hypothetical protein